MGKCKIDDELRRKLARATVLLGEAGDAMSDLANDDLPEALGDGRQETEALNSMDDALGSVEEAQDALDRCYAILTGEWEDEDEGEETEG